MKFQSYNKRINAWVMFEKMPNGRTKILNVKQVQKSVPFSNIKKKIKRR